MNNRFISSLKSSILFLQSLVLIAVLFTIIILLSFIRNSTKTQEVVEGQNIRAGSSAVVLFQVDNTINHSDSSLYLPYFQRNYSYNYDINNFMYISGLAVDKRFNWSEFYKCSMEKVLVPDAIVDEGKILISEFFSSECKLETVQNRASTCPFAPYESYAEILVASEWDGQVLSYAAGRIWGPSGQETYYNLPMDGVLSMMRAMGNTDEYWIREDGVKMLGDYVMIAANLHLRPRGSLVPTSLGMGIVCDTGGFADFNPTQIDVAVSW